MGLITRVRVIAVPPARGVAPAAVVRVAAVPVGAQVAAVGQAVGRVAAEVKLAAATYTASGSTSHFLNFAGEPA